ncbi:DUF362 domain-containing protein, partial [Thermodesulfobacteriota bacterium]
FTTFTQIPLITCILKPPLEKMGIKGLDFPKHDLSLCTYCAGFTDPMLRSIAEAWDGKPFDDVEVLTGKVMKPSGRSKKTILLGKCMCQANKDNNDISEMIQVKGCPPSTSSIIKALHKAGIKVDPSRLEEIDNEPGLFTKRYEGKPGFDESLFRIEL